MNNSGFARVIYEGSDASFQLRSFYKEISCLIMSNITFKYVDTQVQIFLIYELYIMFCSLFVNCLFFFWQVDEVTLTKTSFNFLFNEAEIFVAGKLKHPNLNFNNIVNGITSERIFLGLSVISCFNRSSISSAPLQQKKHIGNLNLLIFYMIVKICVVK